MKKQNKVAVIGCGTVGYATAKLFKVKKCFRDQLSIEELEELKNYTYIFLCLPTPTIDGVQDTQIIRNYVRDISAVSKEPVLIIRSTVLPGTAHNLSTKYGIKIVSSPEFLSEDTAKKDTFNPDYVVIGADNTKLLVDVSVYFKRYYKKVPFIKTNTITAETLKYAINSFFVTKVVFANEMYEYARKFGANYEVIKEGMYKNRYIGPNHLDIFHKRYRGAGGKCLMKDMNAFTNHIDTDFFRFIDGENMRLLRANGKD